MHRINQRKFLMLSGGAAGSVLLTRCTTNPTALLSVESATAIAPTTSRSGLLEEALLPVQKRELDGMVQELVVL
jgi:hypothetical protein